MTKYAKENQLSNTRFYVDDGCTGTNFRRPGFQKLLEDIEMGYPINFTTSKAGNWLTNWLRKL